MCAGLSVNVEMAVDVEAKDLSNTIHLLKHDIHTIDN